MAYQFLIDAIHKLNIGSGFNLEIEGDGSTISVLKMWNGTGWELVYKLKVGIETPRLKRWNGVSWEYVYVV